MGESHMVCNLYYVRTTARNQITPLCKMKTLLLLGLAIACVYCETCSTPSDCMITTCSTGTIACSGGICTCTTDCDPEQDYTRCRDVPDCVNSFNNGAFNCDCAITDLHCIDGRCHCGYPSNPPA